ncbi:hypothetical protein Hanom_Chr09g00775201 [Helianthus anomalus]
MGRGDYRSADSFLSKWTAMRTMIINFNNIHNSLVNSHTRRSGSSDVDIMIAAHNEYRMHHGLRLPCYVHGSFYANLQSGILYHRLT